MEQRILMEQPRPFDVGVAEAAVIDIQKVGRRFEA